VQTGTVYANYQADPGTGAELYLGGAAVTVQGTVFQGATASLTGPSTVSPDALTASVNVQQSTGGNDTLIGPANFGDTFLGTSAGLAGDLIKGFGGSDAIDITDISAASVHPLSFNTSAGQLTVADGTHSVTLTFTGSYTAGSFATPVNDGHGGTLIKFG